MAEFGKLEKVSIRDGWPREDVEFTPWLCRPENLASLGNELKLELELVERESAVGTFRADILALRTDTNENVVIENQFGRTDHSHLGQLLTYSASVGIDGGGARTIVWIAEHFSEPHRAALDWLNKVTDQGIRFFGVELELWKIGGSLPAPKFNVVSRPNDWQKHRAQEATATSQTQDLYFEFWTEFVDFCELKGTILRMHTPQPRHWLVTTIGKTGVTVNLWVSRMQVKMECHLWLNGPNAKHVYRFLEQKKTEITSALGTSLIFDPMSDKKAAKIYEVLAGDINNRADWPQMFAILKERGEAFAKTFAPLVVEA